MGLGLDELKGAVVLIGAQPLTRTQLVDSPCNEFSMKGSAYIDDSRVGF